METLTLSDSMPMAALSIGDFKNLFQSLMVQPMEVQKVEPELMDKALCSEFTKYSINTINKMISERKIPFYKNHGRVTFLREEIRDWMLSRKVSTIDATVEQMEAKLSERGAKL